MNSELAEGDVMADHYLCLQLGEYGADWTLRCDHEPDAYPAVDEGKVDPDVPCWAAQWFDLTDPINEALMGEWPTDITFPCPVQTEWVDGLIIYYGCAT